MYDIVIQNYPACNQVCETHAWHFHGHSFWVLGHGKGTWIGSEEQLNSLNIINPPKRDTTIVIPDGVKPFEGLDEQGGCGYTVVRFVANNPGTWFFHCHQNWHIIMGMNALFYYGVDQLPPPPRNFRTCGDLEPSVLFGITSEEDCSALLSWAECTNNEDCKWRSKDGRCTLSNKKCSDYQTKKRCKSNGCYYNDATEECKDEKTCADFMNKSPCRKADCNWSNKEETCSD